MSEARSTTSGDEERTSRRNSLRASLSPASAFWLRLSDSPSRAFVSSGRSSALTHPPPFSLVPVVSAPDKFRSDEDLCRVVKF